MSSDVNPLGSTSASSPVETDATFGNFDEEGLIEIEMQTAGIDQQDLKIQKDEIQKRNDQLKQLQDILSALDAQTPSDASQDTKETSIVIPDTLYDQFTKSSAAQAAGVAHLDTPLPGMDTIVFPAGGATKAVAALKDQIQGLSQDSQLDMISLQSRLNSYNQRVETITNMVQKKADTADKIVGNLR